jgi:hypothetical protein
MAPECFEPRVGGVTGKADVFSFAIMLWEVRDVVPEASVSTASSWWQLVSPPLVSLLL